MRSDDRATSRQTITDEFPLLRPLRGRVRSQPDCFGRGTAAANRAVLDAELRCQMVNAIYPPEKLRRIERMYVRLILGQSGQDVPCLPTEYEAQATVHGAAVTWKSAVRTYGDKVRPGPGTRPTKAAAQPFLSDTKLASAHRLLRNAWSEQRADRISPFLRHQCRGARRWLCRLPHVVFVLQGHFGLVRAPLQADGIAFIPGEPANQSCDDQRKDCHRYGSSADRLVRSPLG